MTPGTQLGSYEVLSPLGKGGMGEVWRARDSKLGREVAIKTLPEEFAQNEERLARFEREAKLLASLNHPNIATIHGLEEDNGIRFLVLELVEGDTLADRLKHGVIPVEESLKLALQIAEALEAAHEKGVIHRDLKPGNIKVTPDGKVKVLDFGLAKAFLGDGSDANLSQSPTLSLAATQQGVILGTAAYMSPEQARGQEVDKRADVWAFGCVLYEMLTGRQAFRGELMSDVMASVLAREPDYSTLHSQLHPRVRELILRCLEKDPRDRWRDVGDLRIELSHIESGVQVSVATPGRERPLFAATLAFATLSVVLAVGLVYFYLNQSEAAHNVVKFSVFPPDETVLAGRGGAPRMAISPDGSRLVYQGTTDGIIQLWVRRMDSLESAPIPGTENATMPFWSPDSQQVGFFADGELRRVDLEGGPAFTISEAPRGDQGGSWNNQGTIIFGGRNPSGPIMRVPASGGAPTPVTNLGETPGEILQTWPSFLPDGRRFVYLSRTDGLTDWTLYVGSLDDQPPRAIMPSASMAQYSEPGHLLFVRDSFLLAQAFDATRGELLAGDAIAVAGDVVLAANGRAAFSVSRDGVLAYARTPGSGGEPRFVWTDQSGVTSAAVLEVPAARPRLSPNGDSLLYELANQDGVYLMDLERGIQSQLRIPGLRTGFALRPIWEPGGQRITITDGDSLYSQSIESLVPPEKLLPENANSPIPESWSPSGRYLAYTVSDPGSRDLWILDRETGQVTAFADQPFPEYQAQFSPDGNRIAYRAGLETGATIFLSEFPRRSRPLQVGGRGSNPAWSPDGDSLYYSDQLQLALMSVPVGADGRLGSASEVLDMPPSPYPSVHPDGNRFLFRQLIEAGSPNPINIVLNWFEELKERVPVP